MTPFTLKQLVPPTPLHPHHAPIPKITPQSHKNKSNKKYNKQPYHPHFHRTQMGNSSKKDQLSNLHQNWITTSQPQSQLLPYVNLYRSRLLINTVTHDYIEEYLVHLISEEDYLHYRRETEWRQGLEHRLPNAYIMPIRAFMDTSSSELCTRSHTACIYFDRVQMRLTDINDIPLGDAMYMLRVCLEGFGLLREHFGVFGVGEDMVFINEEGEVTVWVHANLSSVIPNRQDKFSSTSHKPRPRKPQPKTPSFLSIPSSHPQPHKQKNQPSTHEQSYTYTDNSYEHSHENTYSRGEPETQESMIKDILAIVEENIDVETYGKIGHFTRFVKERVNFGGAGTGMGNGNGTGVGGETSRNRLGRVVGGSRFNGDSGSNQGSQKVRRRGYNFGNVLELYKEYIQEYNINVPRRMQAIHGIYKNNEPNPKHRRMVHSLGTDKSPQRAAQSASNSQKNSSLNNSQTSNHLKPHQPPKNPNNNPNNNNNTNLNDSINQIQYNTNNSMNMNMNMNNSLFHGNYDESAVMHIGNGGKLVHRYGLDSGRTGPLGRKSQVNNSLNVVDVGNQEHLRSKLYSESYTTNFQPVNNNRAINPNNALFNDPTKSLNNSRMSNHLNPNPNPNPNPNSNPIVKLKQKQPTPAQPRRLATQGSEYNPNPPIPNLNTNPYITENNTARSRNSSIEVNKLHSSVEYKMPVLNYNSFNGGLHVQHSQHPQSQNSSINSNFGEGKTRDVPRVYQHVNISGNGLNSNPGPVAFHHTATTRANKQKQSQQIKIKYHSPLSTLLEQKYDHGSRLTRTNHHNPLHPKITITATNPNLKNGYHRHTSNESAKLEPKMYQVSGPGLAANVNAIKYVKTPYVSINARREEYGGSPAVSKPNSVTLASKNVDYGHVSPAYVEKYIRDTQQTSNQASNTIHYAVSTQANPLRPQPQQVSQPIRHARIPIREPQKQKQKQIKYYTSNECYELDSEIAYDLADINTNDV